MEVVCHIRIVALTGLVLSALSLINGVLSADSQPAVSEMAYVNGRLSAYSYLPDSETPGEDSAAVARTNDERSSPHTSQQDRSDGRKQPLDHPGTMRNWLTNLQKFANLRVTGTLDKETAQLFREIRRKDMDTDSSSGSRTRREIQALRRSKRYKISTFQDGTVNKWKTDVLTWKITRHSRQLPVATQDRIMREAIAVWAAVVPIKFVEERGNKVPAIDIWFTTGSHGTVTNDPSFQTNGNQDINKLAHAFGPGYDPFNIAGDVHFDDDDDWSNAATLKAVAVHELGHSMGLLHSQDDSAVMYAFYRDIADLGVDDIRGIQALYGGNGGRPIRPQTPRPDSSGRRTPRPDGSNGMQEDALCSARLRRVDAVFRDPSTKFTPLYFAISGDRIHRLTNKGLVIQSKKVESLFPGAPPQPYVVFSDLEKNSVYFIKDLKLWQFQDHSLVKGFPRPIPRGHFPETPTLAFDMVDSRNGKRTLLFGNKYWWHYDTEELRKPQVRQINGAFPQNIRFAAQWHDGLVYAVKDDNSYVILDMRGGSTIQTRPVSGKPYWLLPLCNYENSGTALRVTWSSVMMMLVLGLVSRLAQS